jgi:hypothetical protein
MAYRRHFRCLSDSPMSSVFSHETPIDQVCIRATPEGQLDFKKAKELLIEVASAATPLADYKIILDIRKAQPGMRTTDLWYLAAELSVLRKAFSRRTAVLCPVEGFNNAEFFALCAQNRGFQIEAFTSFEDAIEWLITNGS